MIFGLEVAMTAARWLFPTLTRSRRSDESTGATSDEAAALDRDTRFGAGERTATFACTLTVAGVWFR